MGQILRLVLGSLILLTITGEPGRAADHEIGVVRRILSLRAGVWRLAKGEFCRAFSNADFPCHSGLCDDIGARSRHVA
jgi:hypothetical protein